VDRSKARTDSRTARQVVHSAALGTEPIALVQQTHGCGQIACLVEQLAEKRTGEARGMRMRATPHPISNARRKLVSARALSRWYLAATPS